MVKKIPREKQGFTLSEVIITLVVIGIVAAITVPMLSNSASDKKWNVAKQKAQATIGEAFRLMTVNGEIDTKLSTQQFVERIIPKYLKLAKTCSNASACGFASSYKKAVGSGSNALPTTWQTSTVPGIIVDGTWANLTNYNHASPNTNSSYFFQTLDGFSVNFFYNPYCATSTKDRANGGVGAYYTSQTSMDAICMMGVYDMNGKKGPNQVGKDLGFVGSFYNGVETKAASVLPHIHNADKLLNSVSHTGKKWVQGAISYCNNLDKDRTWTLANHNEMSLLYLNMKLVWGWTGSQDKFYYTRSDYGRLDAATGTYFGQIGFSSNHRGNRAIGNWEASSGSPIIFDYFICVRANALK